MGSWSYLIFFLTFYLISISSLTSSQHVDAIYQFGDSFSDTGNLLIENGKLGSCGRFPYGETFFKQPTGRCSNGRLIVDFFAKAYNLTYLNPYLSKQADFSHGVNFAVGGATALSPLTLGTKGIASQITNSSLSVQLNWFKSHLKSICSHQTECKAKLRNALFRVGEIGGNDLNFAMMQGKTAVEVASIIPDVIKSIISTTKELIDLGATYVVIPGNFPIGCIPLYLANAKTTKVDYNKLGCLKATNRIPIMYNRQLQQAISKLQTEYKNGVTRIVYADYYKALIWLIRNAKLLGFDEESKMKTCCGKGDNVYNMGERIQCGEDGIGVCSDPRKVLSWDGVHFTQKANNHIVKWLLKDMQGR